MRRRIFKILCFLLLLTLISIKTVNIEVSASTPYKTYTLNRYGELVETQDAYDPIKSVKTIEIDGKDETINNAQDLYIDDDNYLYLADTGNKRIIIMNNEFKHILSFGSDILLSPLGVFVRDDLIYVADYGDDADETTGKIVIYRYNKEANTVEVDRILGAPSSQILAVDGFKFRPEKIAVDQNNTMYIVNKGSTNGILLVNSNNRFLNYFAPNQATGTFWDLIVSYLYKDKENVNGVTDITAAAPTNVMLDDSGYIYTVTSTVIKNDLGDTVKKVNIGGVNFYPEDMHVSSSFIDSWTSDFNTVYAISSNGFIYEYDTEGNLLFKFAGNIADEEQLGLFKSASSIATDSNGDLFIVDPNSSSIQVFRKTNFTNKVHSALVLYMSGKYIESKEIWEDILVYNSMFDLAHKAIGLAYYLEGDYKAAMNKFEIAYDKENYSEAFWEVRNEFLMNNLPTIVIIIVSLAIVLIAVKITNKKYGYLKPVKDKIKKFLKIKGVSDALIFFKFVKHPYDTIYDIRKDKSIKVYNGFIMLGLIFIVYLINITLTGFIFNNVVLEKTILLKECTKIILPILLFVISNYLVSSLMNGEGTLRCIFMNTMGALVPVVLMLPVIVLISNGLTYNEAFIYYFAMGIMLIWTAILLIATIKETHNYSLKQTFANLLLTVFMMFILIIVIILVYLIISQIAGFIIDIVKEVMF